MSLSLSYVKNLIYKKYINDNYDKIYLWNPDIRNNNAFNVDDIFKLINDHTILNFESNNELKCKDYIITLLGYTKTQHKHTNWFPWNRFKDVFETIGYKCEWLEIENLHRKNEKRIFITWNEPTSLELYKTHKIKEYDIVFQKLTSLGKGMNNVNWTKDPKEWCKKWNWPIFQTLEYLYDLGVNIYGFGCKTNYIDFPEKKRICEKMKDRIFWITWGGTPFTLKNILNSKPIMNTPEKNVLEKDISFIGSKWGKVGRGNIDAWEKYLTPLEKDGMIHYGGMGKFVTDEDMVKLYQKTKLCPIIHAPSWQAERGIQDRFYSVFISGRFGICDNLGAIDIFGDEIEYICEEDPIKYYEKSIYFLYNMSEQLKYIEFIQTKIKKQYNFYVQWYNILSKIEYKKSPLINDYLEMIKSPIVNNPINTSINTNINTTLYTYITDLVSENYQVEKFNDFTDYISTSLIKTNNVVLNEINTHLLKNCKVVNIIGNGPSLRNVELKTLRNKINVAYNRSYIIYKERHFYPTFYFCIDKVVLLNCVEDIINLLDSPIQKFVLLDCVETRKIQSDKVVLIQKDPKNTQFFGDVAVFSIYYLKILGYKKYNIYGCDCNYVEDYDLLNVDVEINNNDPARRIILIPREGSIDPNHFIDNYFEFGTEYSVPRTKNHVYCWKNIIKCHKSKEINISFKTKSRITQYL